MGTIFFYHKQSDAPLQLSLDVCEGMQGSEIQDAIFEALALPHCDQYLVVDGIPLSELTWGDSLLRTGAEIRFIENEYTPDASVYRITAVDGPDTGQTFRIARGKYSLGKGTDSQLRFQDDALSNIHGELTITNHGITLDFDGKAQNIQLGTQFAVGNSIFRISRNQEKRLQVNRTVDLSAVEVELPPKRQNWMYLLMVLAPLAVGVLVVTITKMWLFLVMSLASSLMMGIHWFMSKGESKKALTILENAALEDAENAKCIPTLEELVDGAIASSPHTLYMVLGNGNRQANIKNRNIDDYRVPVLQDVPLAIGIEKGQNYLLDMPTSSIRAVLLGICSQGREIVLLDGYVSVFQEEFSALSMLPNVSLQKSAELQQATSQLPRIIVMSGQAWENQVFEAAPTDTVFVLGKIPSYLFSNFAHMFRASGYFQEKISWVTGTDNMWSCWSQGISLVTLYRAVGRRIGQQNNEILLDAATHRLEPFALGCYSQNSYYAEDLIATIGVSEAGLITAGLSADGPHWLIAGTTGSGKSEVLRTMLLSLVLRYPTQRMAFSLIDFKGAATLGVFGQLPHVSNVLSDLNAESVERALRYYKTDLVAREKEFQRLGVSSYPEYLALHRSSSSIPRFPELVIVVDEFKMLVDQLPQAMNDLMKVAVIGRSLGVHLVLATQRPQGAVSQDIRANIALNICLRVASPQDSHNVLGSDVASNISSKTPGRGFIARSGEPPLEFQAPLFTGVFERLEKPVAYLEASRRDESNNHQLSLEEAIAKLSTVAKSSYASYVPVPPELSPTTSNKILSDGIFYLGESESPELSLRESAKWVPNQDGSLALLDSPTQRKGIVAALIEQASALGRKIIVFAADRLMYEAMSRALTEGKISGTFSGQDLSYCEYVIDQVLNSDSTRTEDYFIVIDSLDTWIDLCSRHPDLESKFHHLLSDGHRFGHAVLATSAQGLRVKTQMCIANLLWSATSIDKDPFKKSSKTFPHPQEPHLVVEGEIAKRMGQDGETTLILSPAVSQMEKAIEKLSTTTPCFAQLPVRLEIEHAQNKPSNLLHRSLYLGMKNQQVLDLRLQFGKFIPIIGKRSSGKTQFLHTLKNLNQEFSYLWIPGKQQFTMNQFEKAISQVKEPHLTILVVDDLNYVDKNIQEKIIGIAPQFTTVLIAYSPWNRWLTSPILAGLQGTSRGIVLMPDSRSSELFMDFEFPADLKTNGRLYPGRGVLINDFATTAFQVPYSEK